MLQAQAYNLTTDNLEGCTDCQCVPGASLDLSCSDSGQCSCIESVQGQTCDTPSDGYFIPKLDYIQLDLKLSTQVSAGVVGEAFSNVWRSDGRACGKNGNAIMEIGSNYRMCIK